MSSDVKKSPEGKNHVLNLQDRFTIDDIVLSSRVKYTYNSGYSRIALATTNDKDIRHTSCNIADKNCGSYKNISVVCYSLKLYYAIQVLQHAILQSYEQKRFVPYWHIQWGGSKPFYELMQWGSTKKNQVENSIAAFWNLLQDTANSGKITVHEQYWLQPTETEEQTYFSSHNAEAYLVIKDASWGERGQIPDWFTHQYDLTPVSYTWDEIKEYFVELSLPQLALTMPHMMHAHSTIDELLLDACRNHDWESIQFALAKGADANALTEQGESALELLIESYVDAAEAIRIIAVLLDAGADIDLFGITGMQPVTAAFYRDDVEIVRHLLERGSNPNYNSFLMDVFADDYDKNVACTILSSIDTKESFDCLEEMIIPEMLEIKELVLQYGGKLFRDDAVWPETDENEKNVL